ncbi:phosphoribosylanthranilate isomerase [Neokomagataea thailandica]|uniref:N-(5'-phosphoribosyl)anthranilate isomerase n=1 Tax=Neokomagataea tanensis NBRC 106556 TaxID=1223519 RepID=A0ABQ0QJV1_9PROT|nr:MULTISPECIES: phosphoribosylanthranilate isomerase [Neokomagataea]GBR47424.1 phosphoribosyl anthranilate isomerase [Neokomagataea tanensis NBRC 106556]
MVGIKICGVRDLETVHLCTELQVEWIGLVFYAPSPRFISIEDLKKIADLYSDHSSKRPRLVGLFVKASNQEIADVLSVINLDILQIYDSSERVHDIRSTFNLPVWQSKGVARAEELPLSMHCDGFVIEAKATPTDSLPGGMGRRFDWGITQNWAAPGFWALAGGLTPDNVARAIQEGAPPAVDVSSGVEGRIGFKSHDLIKKFVENAREALAPPKELG